MNRHARTAMRPAVESLESLCLMSVVPSLVEGLKQPSEIHALSGKSTSSMKVPVTLSGGSISGYYTVVVTSQSSTKHFENTESSASFNGKVNGVTNLTPATAVGTLNISSKRNLKTLALTLSGNGTASLARDPFDTLTLSFSKPVEVTLEVLQMHYKITKSAGMYKGDKGSGTATFTFAPEVASTPAPVSVTFS